MRRLLALLPLVALVACDRPETSHNHADSLAAEHAGDSTGATAMVQESRVPVVGRDVTYGGHAGYYAVPRDSAGVEAGLVMIHEWWGLNDNIRAMARRYAGEGYRVLAVDLYDGAVADTPDSASALLRKMTDDIAGVRANTGAAYAFLEARGDDDIGVLGWCAGGSMALQAALGRPDDFDALVIYYGHVSDATVGELRTLDMPVRGFFGEADSSIPVEAVRQFEQRLQEAGVASEITLYPGAGHAFANPTGNNYEEGPAQDSWQKTLAFLDQHLKDS